MTFTKPWIAFPQDPDTKVPVLDVYFRTADGQETRELFVVDSGADVSGHMEIVESGYARTLYGP